MEKNYENYTGIDADLETSLFEYGFIWTKNENDYHFIYGVEVNNEYIYNKFEQSSIPIDTNPIDEWGWINWDDVEKFCGMNKEEFLKQDLPYIIYDLVSYYGYEDILGSSYSPFEINKGDLK